MLSRREADRRFVPLLAACAVFALLLAAYFLAAPGKAFALTEGDWEYEEIEGETGVRITKYNGTATEVTVPSALGGKTVTQLNNPETNKGTFYSNQTVKKITVPNTVTYLGITEFYNCKVLEEVVLPDTITEIGQSCFSRCPKLYKLNIPASLKVIPQSFMSKDVPEGSNMTLVIPEGLEEIQASAFLNVKLESVSFPSTLTTVRKGAFQKVVCESITIPNTMTDIENGAFYTRAANLVVSADNPNYKMVGQCLLSKDGKRLCGMQYSSEFVDEFRFPDGIESLEGQASESIRAYKVVVPGSVKTVGKQSLRGLYLTTEVVFEEGVEEVDTYCFDICYKLEKVTFPSTIRKIGLNIFNSCSVLSELYFYATTAPELEIYSFSTTYTFPGTVTAVHVPEAADGYNATVWSNVSSKLVYDLPGDPLIIAKKNAKAVLDTKPDRSQQSQPTYNAIRAIVTAAKTNIDAAETVEQVETLLSEANAAIEQVIADELAEWSYEELDSGSLKITGYSGDATEVTVPDILAGKYVTVIGEGAFENKTEITKVTLHSRVATIEDRAFKDMTSLAQVSSIPSSVMLGESVFRGCTSLGTFTLPSNLTALPAGTFAGAHVDTLEIGSKLQTIEGDALAGQVGKFTVNSSSRYFKRTGTSLLSYDQKKFYAAEYLSTTMPSFTIPETVETLAPYSCATMNVQTAVLPEGLSEIGANAFAGNTVISSLTIPAGVEEIGQDAFKGAAALTEITVLADPAPAFSDHAADNAIVKIHVNYSAEGYDAATWNEYQIVRDGDLDEIRETAKQEVNEYADPDDYGAAHHYDITQYKTAALIAIDEAEDVDGVLAAVQAYKDRIDLIPKKQEEDAIAALDAALTEYANAYDDALDAEDEALDSFDEAEEAAEEPGDEAVEACETALEKANAAGSAYDIVGEKIDGITEAADALTEAANTDAGRDKAQEERDAVAEKTADLTEKQGKVAELVSDAEALLQRAKEERFAKYKEDADAAKDEAESAMSALSAAEETAEDAKEAADGKQGSAEEALASVDPMTLPAGDEAVEAAENALASVNEYLDAAGGQLEALEDAKDRADEAVAACFAEVKAYRNALERATTDQERRTINTALGKAEERQQAAEEKKAALEEALEEANTRKEAAEAMAERALAIKNQAEEDRNGENQAALQAALSDADEAIRISREADASLAEIKSTLEEKTGDAEAKKQAAEALIDEPGPDAVEACEAYVAAAKAVYEQTKQIPAAAENAAEKADAALAAIGEAEDAAATARRTALNEEEVQAIDNIIEDLRNDRTERSDAKGAAEDDRNGSEEAIAEAEEKYEAAKTLRNRAVREAREKEIRDAADAERAREEAAAKAAEDKAEAERLERKADASKKKYDTVLEEAEAAKQAAAEETGVDEKAAKAADALKKAEKCKEAADKAKTDADAWKEAADAAVLSAVTEEDQAAAAEKAEAAEARANAAGEAAAAAEQAVTDAQAVKQAADTAKAEKDEEERRKEEEERKKREDVDEITPSDLTAEEAKVDDQLAVTGAKAIGNFAKKTFKVSWTAEENAVNYRISWRRAGDTAWTTKWSAGKTQYTLSEFAAGGLYEFRVQAFSKKKSVWTKSAYSKTLYRFLRKGKVRKIVVGKKQMTVRITKAKGATSYKIKYSLKKNMKGAKTKTTAKLSLKIKKLKAGKKYYVKVTPVAKYGGHTYLGIISPRKASVKIKK